MLTHQQHQELKRVTPVFATLPEPLDKRLRQEAEYVTVEAGKQLIADGDTYTRYFAITSGAIRVSKLTEDGREILYYFARPGELCILSVTCILGATTFPAQAVCEGPVSGVSLPGELFNSLVREVPEVRDAVFDLLSTRVSTLMRLVEEVAFHKLDRRLAAMLIRRSNGNASVEITHNQLAEDLGSSREIISRILEGFEVQGIVALGRKRITIRDHRRLEGISSPA